MRPLLFVFESAPYDGLKMREGLEALFAARIFDVQCTAILLGDAVYACLEEQQERSDHAYKKISKMLASLPMYDIEELMIHQDSAIHRQITAPCLPGEIPVKTPVIDNTRLAALFAEHDHILSF